MRLQNKVAIVTGGARDIGRSISLKLAKEGAKVAINYFDSEEEGKATLEAVQAAGGEAILVQGDMTKAEDVANFVAKTQEAFGNEINVLVNVVGGLVARKPLAEMDEDFVNLVMRLNFNSTFLMTKAVSPHMPKGGSIVNFASQAARDGGGGGAWAYAASKGAVMTFTRSMAKEFGPRGIRVNALDPGLISTTFHDTFSKNEVREKVAGMTALGREGHPDEVADVVAYLASDESSFVNGVNLDVNGGLAFS
ncbi:SDR family NAD(P)-dependent oxidoreductase [Hirschia baltica]|uniref:Short-chain dehydrogenase/reductase SDR n=1 Tax=Hirschia baltica (strain ATCC 49814 / DSM 5838 / IFAM 1418) TaxID=582402 RepID=C6XQE3_HIRBI|nr:glucose 1-dehydrogenase [Hirschia baltica]ACT60442.1 short-chain dehydrogenase/reductase SDR [Hirschia baltica ATCC 49814]